MTIYALVSPENAVDRMATNIDPATGTKPGWRWLPVEGEHPQYDAAAQIVSGPEMVVYADRMLRVWAVRDKTAEELSAEDGRRRARILASLPDIITRTLLDHENRLRAMEGVKPAAAEQLCDDLGARV